MIRFLHFVMDEKFSPIVIPNFDKRTDIKSQYIYYNRYPKRPLRYLKNLNQVEILNNRSEVIKELKSNKYDVLYIHSLYITTWQFLKFVPKNKIIIWWLWGYELYLPSPYGQRHSFFDFETILPFTKRAIKRSTTNREIIKKYIQGVLLDLLWPYYKRSLLKKIDFFRPVIHKEYELMTRLKEFHAKEFYLPRINPNNTRYGDAPIMNTIGAIQIGNSASGYCNHIDVWNDIKQYVPKNSKVIIPLSYGDVRYAEYVKETIRNEHSCFESLDGFLPRDQYFNKVKQCTYFVHGAIRQHAMNNIYNALVSGRKVFLYKKSLIYQYLIENGYVVFAIEDLTESSFCTPLSMDEFQMNLNARMKELEIRDKIGEKSLNEIRDFLSNNH